MEVIFKEGMLYLQGAKFGKKTWRKIWVVLFKPSCTGVGRLEFYPASDSTSISDQFKSSRQKTQERKVVRLSDCLSVTPAAKESCPDGCTAFYLNTTRSKYTFASKESQDWLSALSLLAFQKDTGESAKGDFEGGNGLTMEENDLYSSWKRALPSNHYHVKVLSTEASKRRNLAGEYLVCPDKEALVLSTVNGGVITRWPYRLLRKFGQVEGGFSIEAGRRCESGEGVFIFLTQHGPEIFQAIVKQCSLEKERCVQHRSANRQSLYEISPPSPPRNVVLPLPTHWLAASPAYNPTDATTDMEDKSACHYSNSNDASIQNTEQSFLIAPSLSGSKEALVEEDEDEDEVCSSLEAMQLENIMEDSLYYNLRKHTPPLTRKTEMANSDCIYSEVAKYDFSSDPQPFFSTLPLPQPPLLPPVDDYTELEHSTQALDEDEMTETKEDIGSCACVTPSEATGTFKQRLAEIISKDLAKFQPPPSFGSCSPTFPQ
ncbi:docking protein 3 [Melanotaenia boesemani]|uniref:docking protein 3 n=1 Tax=Melanotaenia boesemani TaxID=1250792 RepID=UPI001C05905B|nr:docking protein 3 [Melanotaenia boesemani]